MPESQQSEKGINIVLDKIFSNTARSVIDFGAGEGKWGKALKGKMQIVDGVEVWGSYILKYNLHNFYDTLYEADMRKFEFEKRYNIAILGDVLEHVSKDEAIGFLNKLKDNVDVIYLTIPVTVCIQDGEAIGNPFETHRYQWSDKEIRYDLGFELLNVSVNDNGLVAVGCYEWIK